MGRPRQQGCFPREDAEKQLRLILSSGVFSSSRRLRDFLRFVVEKALAGQEQQIKEYLIGTEVFGRGESYDPRTDPIVRVEAGRLRSKLAEYYRDYGGADPVLIDLPKGGYVPVFRARALQGTPAWPGIASWPRLPS